MRVIGMLVVAVALLLSPAAAWAQVSVVSDINPGAAPSFVGGTEIETIGGTIYFWADDGVHGKELWKSNGSTAGTALVKDINPGAAGALPEKPGVFLAYTEVAGGTLYFAANDGVHGTELWKTNGTSDGTVLVKDIRPGGVGSEPGAATSCCEPGRIVNVGGTLYFPAATTAYGAELFKSDGSAAGTTRVKDINPGSGSAKPQLLTVVGNNVFFRAVEPSGGFELFKSDGTAAGTTQVRDIIPGANSSFPRSLTAVGSTLYFTAVTAASGRELWKSNGSQSFTFQLGDINPGPGDSTPQQLTARGSRVFFTATDGTRGVELWKSDGSTPSTILVRDIDPTNGDSSPFPYALTTVGSSLFFGASEPATGAELWKSDGTAATTTRLTDIKPGAAGSFPNSIVSLGGVLYFTAFDATRGKELFALRDSGPVLVHDIVPGSGSSSPFKLTPVQPSPITPRFDKLLFFADDGTHGVELWKLEPESTIG